MAVLVGVAVGATCVFVGVGAPVTMIVPVDMWAGVFSSLLSTVWVTVKSPNPE